MATPGGAKDIDLGEPRVPDDSAIWSALDGEPFQFQFFQAVRLLELLMPDREPVGRFVHPSQEAVRFGANPIISFPPSQIRSITRSPGAPAHMDVNFIGMTGPLGVLPIYYTELIIARGKAKDRTLRDFLDIFNHRITSLFYQAWRKYRFTVAYERGERDKFSHHLLDLVGLGTEGLQDRQSVADDSLIHYAGLLGQWPRSAAALRQLLTDYFEVPVEIEQFAGDWYRLDEDTQCCFEDGVDPSQQLGLGAVVGDAVWDQQSSVCVKLGPLTLEEYLDFLPNGSAFQPLRALLGFFAGSEFDFDVQLVLKREEVPRCELGAEDEVVPQLGWVTWMKSAPFTRDPAETILEGL